MNKTKIEWTNYSINPIKGLCKRACWYCYAKKMYQRFKWNSTIKFIPEELDKIKHIKKPSRIFICSTHDLFGEWIPDKWIFNIITKLQTYPQHTFLLLTKNPNRYRDFTFRKNFWLGMTVDSSCECYGGSFWHINHPTFVSVEPLLKEITFSEPINTNWIIIGALTGPKKNIYYPREQWIRKILTQVDRYNIPVFMKNNLKRYWEGEFRQEFPKEA